MNLSDLEAEVRAAAAREPLPVPSPAQCAAILQRRAQGERLTIPSAGAVARPLWTVRVLSPAAIAAAVLFLFWTRAEDTHRAGTGPSLAPGMLLAQSSARPRYPVLGPGVRPLQPGGWVYTGELPDEIRPRDVLFVYRVAQSNYEGQAAWLLLAGKQAPDSAPVFSDSTWVSRDQLAVLAHHRDTTVLGQPVPANFLAVLQAAELSDDWSASVPLLGGSQSRWMNLKVYGQETIKVPAGRFACWKVGFAPSIGFYFWISRDNGWPVRQGMERPENLAYGKMNLMLMRREQP